MRLRNNDLLILDATHLFLLYRCQTFDIVRLISLSLRCYKLPDTIASLIKARHNDDDILLMSGDTQIYFI